MAERSRNNPHGAANFRKINAARVIKFTEPMEAALLSDYAAGRNLEFMCEHLGVSRDVVQRELRARDLPVGRWVKRKKVS